MVDLKDIWSHLEEKKKKYKQTNKKKNCTLFGTTHQITETDQLKLILNHIQAFQVPMPFIDIHTLTETLHLFIVSY